VEAVICNANIVSGWIEIVIWLSVLKFIEMYVHMIGTKSHIFKRCLCPIVYFGHLT